MKAVKSSLNLDLDLSLPHSLRPCPRNGASWRAGVGRVRNLACLSILCENALVVLDMWTLEFSPCHNSFSQPANGLQRRGYGRALHEPSWPVRAPATTDTQTATRVRGSGPTPDGSDIAYWDSSGLWIPQTTYRRRNRRAVTRHPLGSKSRQGYGPASPGTVRASARPRWYVRRVAQ